MVSEIRNGERVYKKKVKTIEKPKEDWVAIPVPDSGIPRGVVDKARANISENRWLSRNGGVVWELTGGIAHCGECGRKMTTVHIPRGNGKSYHYYRCRGVVEKTCRTRNYKAYELENKVTSSLKQLFSDKENFRLLINDFFDCHIRELRRRNPDRESKVWAERITTLKTNLSRAQNLAIEGLLSKEELIEKAHGIKEGIQKAERELGKLSEINGDIVRLEQNRKFMLENYVSDLFFSNYSSSDEEGIPTDFEEIDASEQRHRFYKDLNLKVLVSSEIDIEIEIAGKGFSKSDNPSETSARTGRPSRCSPARRCTAVPAPPARC